MRHVVNRAHGVDGSDPRSVLAIPREHRRRLTLVHGEPVPHRFRLVILSAHEGSTAVLAALTGLATGIRRLALLADRARPQALHELVIIDVEHEHGVHAPPELREHTAHTLGLRRRADDAVEQGTLGELAPA